MYMWTKNKKRILLNLGVMSALFTTSSIVISCGNSNPNPNPPINTDQQKLNGITINMLIQAITDKLSPSTSLPTPKAPENNNLTNISINGLDGVTIVVSQWMQNIDGSVNFTVVEIYKGTATIKGEKFGNIVVSGFEKNSFSKISGQIGDVVRNLIHTSQDKYFVAADSGLWVSVDNCQSFTKENMDGRTDISIWTIAEGASGIIFVGTVFNGLWISTPNQENFTMDNHFTGKGNISSIYSFNSNLYIGTEGTGLWVTSDEGTTFNSVTIGTSKQENWSISSIYKTNSNKLFVGTDATSQSITIQPQGLWVSIDGGTTFTQVSNGIGKDWEISSVYQTQDNNIYVGTKNHGLWVSSDVGSTFNLVTKGLVNNWTINSTYQTTDGKIFVATSGNGLWLSIDKGSNFTQVTNGIGDNWKVNSIYQVTSTNPTINGKIFLSIDDHGLWASNY